MFSECSHNGVGLVSLVFDTSLTSSVSNTFERILFNSIFTHFCELMLAWCIILRRCRDVISRPTICLKSTQLYWNMTESQH